MASKMLRHPHPGQTVTRWIHCIKSSLIFICNCAFKCSTPSLHTRSLSNTGPAIDAKSACIPGNSIDFADSCTLPVVSELLWSRGAY